MINQDKNVQSDPLQASVESPRLFDTPNNSNLGGPQFGLENQMSPKDKFRNWISKYGSSVILPIIALAILAGGIYLYTSQQSQQASLFSEGDLANIQGQIPGLEEELVADSNQEASQIAKEKSVIEKIIPEGRKEGNKIIEKAAAGDGVTHLARRALGDYLEDHSQDLTNEHKIYIEDYLKDSIGSKSLEIGEEITFSEDLIEEAINASLELTPEQLQNLEQYSALVAW